MWSMGSAGWRSAPTLGTHRSPRRHCGRLEPPDIIPKPNFLSTKSKLTPRIPPPFCAFFYVLICLLCMIHGRVWWSWWRTNKLRWPNPTVQVATQSWRVRTFSALCRQIFHTEVFQSPRLVLQHLAPSSGPMEQRKKLLVHYGTMPSYKWGCMRQVSAQCSSTFYRHNPASALQYPL